MSNYYVHRNHDYDDELAHAFGFRKIGSKKPGHKYYAREGSPGRYRYFYSPAEYAAYKAGQTIKKGATAVRNGVTSGVSKASYAVRRAAGKAGTAVANATGYSAKQRADRLTAYADRQHARAFNTAPGANRTKAFDQWYSGAKAARGARKEYSITPLGKLERTAKDARLKVTDAAGKVRNVVGKAGNKLLDAAGRSEKERLQRLDLNYRRRARTANLNANASYEESQRLDKLERQAGKAAGRAADSYYRHTLMGRAESAASKAKSAVSGAAGKAKSAASSAAGTVRKTARKAGTAVANATGYSEKQRAKRLESYANRSQQRYEQSRRDYDGSNKSLRTLLNRQATANDAHYAARNARNSYNHTLMGRGERSNKKTAYAVREAAGRVSGAAKTARNAVGSAANSAVNTVKDWRKKKTTKNRPHQRKTKKLNGTATVRKGDRVYY